MIYQANTTAYMPFTTNSSSGAATNADSLPTATIYRNGTSDGALTVTNVSTGAYMCTVPVGAYMVGDDIAILVAATISGVACKFWIGKGYVDVTINSRHASGTAVTLPDPAPAGYGPATVQDADIDWSFEAKPTSGGNFVLQSQSVEFLKVLPSASIGGRLIDPTVYSLEFAFLVDSSTVDSATWHATEWDDNGCARLLMGPSNTILTAGAYFWYVRVASSPETTICRLPQVLRVE